MTLSSGASTRYGRFERAQELAAYEGLRELILTRQIAVGEVIDPIALADALDVDAPHLQPAMVRLATEFLLARDHGGGYRVAPVTTELADSLFAARTAIEVGVIDTHGSVISSQNLDALRALAAELAMIVGEPMPELNRFLGASNEYHARLVGIAGSPPLTAAYLGLGISALWRSAIADLDWWNRFDVTHHSLLTAALSSGDLERAKSLVSEHERQVSGLVRDVIGRRGGTL